MIKRLLLDSNNDATGRLVFAVTFDFSPRTSLAARDLLASSVYF